MIGRTISLPLLNGKLASLNRVMLVFLLIISLILVNYKYASAAQLSDRLVVVRTSEAGAVTRHTFNYITATNTSIGSVVYNYCSNLPIYTAPCTAPAGLDIASSSISAQSGITGLSKDIINTTPNRLVLTRAPSLVAPTAVQIDLDNVTNQSTINQTVYVRIGIYNSIDGTGTPIDFGSVVYTTNDGLGVGGYVPPYLTFCVGVTVASNCTSTSGSLVSFGELSTTTARSTTSQFAGATNDFSGYNTYINGSTMTSGNNIIPALSSNNTSINGVSQFGINLRANSNPSAGANVSGSGVTVPTASYNIPNSFRFNNGEMITTSTKPTNYNRFTVTYMVNISEAQSPGIYASIFTYTAAATF